MKELFKAKAQVEATNPKIIEKRKAINQVLKRKRSKEYAY